MSDRDFRPPDDERFFVTDADLSESRLPQRQLSISDIPVLEFAGYAYFILGVLFGPGIVGGWLGSDAPNSLLGLALGVLLALPFGIFALWRGIGTQARLGIPIFRNLIFLRDMGQAVFLLAVIAFVYLLFLNLQDNLAASDLAINFGILERTFGTEVSEGPDPASDGLNKTLEQIPIVGEDLATWKPLLPNSNLRALMVGFVNTMRVVWLSLIFATILGVLVGIGLLANNWLVRTVSVVYVEIFRNTPLLVQLFFISKGVLLLLPTRQNASEPYGFFDITYINGQRDLDFNSTSLIFFAVLLLGLFYTLFRLWYELPRSENLGQAMAASHVNRNAMITIVIAIVVLVGIGSVADSPISYNLTIDEQVGTTASVDQPNWINISDEAGFSPITREPDRIVSPQLFYLSGQRFNYPKPISRDSFWWFMGPLLAGLVVAIVWSRQRIRLQDQTGTPANVVTYFLGSLFAFGFVGYLLALVVGGGAPIGLEIPVFDRANTIRIFRPDGGSEYTAEYIGLFISLVLYTAAFIADIVRAGIQSVSWGQVEAARAVGLNGGQTMRMIILPQALRLIIPPLTNQYLNLAKNSSLAIAIGYADLYGVATIVQNQTGQAVALFAIMMVTYLSLSLLISLVMNTFNRSIQIKER